MLKIAVCDDAKAVCSELEQIILEFRRTTKMEVSLEIFYTGEKLIKYLKTKSSFDLIFLDIELEKMNGIEVGQFIRRNLEDYVTKIIYISSKSQYDRQLFEVQPLHFLEKPLTKEKIISDINLAIKILGKENNIFSFHQGHEVFKIPMKDILYFESQNKQIKLVCRKRIYYYYGKIEGMIETELNSSFIRPHRSYIVNYDYVSLLRSDQIEMVNGDMIPISQAKRHEIRQFQICYTRERQECYY